MGSTPEEELLRANRAFYAAFASGDIEAMDELWAHRTPVLCVHPGWEPLYGRAEVMESWRAILLGGRSPLLRCDRARALLQGETGLVCCVEYVETGTLVATNGFVLEDGIWQIAHHQAGPLTALDEPGGRSLN